MTLTASLVSKVRPMWDQQLRHPFVQALGDGTLPRENAPMTGVRKFRGFAPEYKV